MSNKITTDLLEFIENSPSCFHAVQTTKEILTKHGFKELSEDQTWNLTPGNDYFVTRNGSSIIAFSIPESVVLQNGFRIIASHSDSPSFKIKENPEMGSLSQVPIPTSRKTTVLCKISAANVRSCYEDLFCKIH